MSEIEMMKSAGDAHLSRAIAAASGGVDSFDGAVQRETLQATILHSTAAICTRLDDMLEALAKDHGGTP